MMEWRVRQQLLKRPHIQFGTFPEHTWVQATEVTIEVLENVRRNQALNRRLREPR